MNLLNINKVSNNQTFPGALKNTSSMALSVFEGHSNGKQLKLKNQSDASKAYASMQINETTVTAQKIWKEIANAQNIVILTHKNADGDAVGSGTALKKQIEACTLIKTSSFLFRAGFQVCLKVCLGPIL